MDHVNMDEEDPVYWRFKHIVAHEGPLDPSSPSYQGSKYDIMMEWESGSLSIIATDDPVACSLYAKENGLLNTDGWMCFKQIAKRGQQLTRMINQAKPFP